MSKRAVGSNGGPDSSTVWDWKKRNTESMKRINSSCQNKPELQLIVIGEIDKYEKLTAGRDGADSTSLATVMAQATAKKQKGETDWDVVKPGELERWQWSYKKWGPGIIKSLAMYCDHDLRISDDSKAWANKEETLRFLEYGWDIQVFAAEGDYVPATDREEVFDILEKAYQQKGPRLRNISVEIRANSVDWTTLGVYSLKETGQGANRKVVIENRLLKRTAEIPQEILDHTTNLSDIKIVKNWSQTRAELMTKKDEIACVTFFPTLKRSLKRANSNADSVAAVGRGKSARVNKPAAKSLAELAAARLAADADDGRREDGVNAGILMDE